ncbi:MAG: DUF4870 domain-containing protein [Candidatus Woesearchaeota archaeon]
MADKKLTSDQTLTAVCSYLFILVLVPLIAVKKRDNFIKFHLSQGLTIFVIEILTFAVIAVLEEIPFVGKTFSFIGNIIFAFFLLVCVIAIIKALSGEKWRIPFMGFKVVNLR